MLQMRFASATDPVAFEASANVAATAVTAGHFVMEGGSSPQSRVVR